MNIREHYQRANARIKAVTVVAGVALGAGLLWFNPSTTRLQASIAGMVIGVPLGVVLLFVRNRLFVCPRCGANFRELRRKQLGRYSRDARTYWELWDKCPQCGVSFDAPYEPISG